MRLNALILTIAWLISCTGVLAAATPPDAGSAEAEALYRDGKADLKDGRVASALEKFQMGLARKPADETLKWGLLIGAGLAAEKLGHAVAALEYLEEFLADMEARPELVDDEWRSRRAAVMKRSRALEAEVFKDNGLVTVTSQPAGARVLLDGRSPHSPKEARTPLKLFLPTGGYALRLERDGFAPVDLNLAVKTGARETVHVPLAALVQVVPSAGSATPAPKPAAEAKPAAKADAVGAGVAPARSGPIVTELAPVASGAGRQAEAPETVTRQAGRQGPSPLWGWIAVGGGAAVALAGVPFTVLAVQDANSMGNLDPSLGQEKGEERYNSLKSGMQSKQALAWVLYGSGLAMAAGGAVYLAFFAGSGGAPGAGDAGPTVTLTPLRGGGVLGLGGRW
jgi:tetratricopeptide (TPR) repeat protein